MIWSSKGCLLSTRMKPFNKFWIKRFLLVGLALVLAFLTTQVSVSFLFLPDRPQLRPAFPQNVIGAAEELTTKLAGRLTQKRQALVGTSPSLPSPWTAPGYIPPGYSTPPSTPTRRFPLPTARTTQPPYQVPGLTPGPTNPPFSTPTSAPNPTLNPTAIPTQPPHSSPTPNPSAPATAQPTVPPTAQPTVPPTSPPTNPPGNTLSTSEQETVRIINQRRRDGGIGQLDVNFQLVGAARRHAQDIHQHGLCQHEGTDGSSPWSRVRDAGYTGQPLGEVAGCGYTTPSAVVDGWWSSPPHKAILTDPNATEIGIGWYPNTGGSAHQVGVTGRR